MHGTLTFSSVPIFLGALLSDWAYYSSQEIQWVNFASWLIAGGLVIAGLSLLWGLIDVLRHSAHRHRAGWGYVILLLSTFVIGLINAFIHGKDGWAAMPTGLYLSVVVFLLAAAAAVMGLSALVRRTAP